MFLLLACAEGVTPAPEVSLDAEATVVLEPGIVNDIAANPAALDFGTVEVGCARTLSLDVRNTGPEVRSCTVITSTEAFTVSTGTIELRPRASRSVAVAFAPALAGAAAGELRVECPEEVDVVGLAAESVPREVRSLQWTQAPAVVADVVLVIDGTASMSEERAQVVSGAYDLADQADDEQRFYLIPYGSPGLAGPIEGAGLVASELEALIPGSDSHAGLDTVLAAWDTIIATARPDAELHLVFVGDSNDQSEVSPEAFLAATPDAVVHGVSGDLPAGCDAATPNEPVATLVEATGGEYLSICSAAWGAALATRFDGSLESRFELENIPVEGTLVVSVDGVVVGGWSYAEVDNQVVFETPPPAGALIEATYEISSC